MIDIVLINILYVAIILYKIVRAVLTMFGWVSVKTN